MSAFSFLNRKAAEGPGTVDIADAGKVIFLIRLKDENSFVSAAFLLSFLPWVLLLLMRFRGLQ